MIADFRENKRDNTVILDVREEKTHRLLFTSSGANKKDSIVHLSRHLTQLQRDGILAGWVLTFLEVLNAGL